MRLSIAAFTLIDTAPVYGFGPLGGDRGQGAG